MAEPILDLSKSLLKNAEAWNTLRESTNKASKRLQQAEKDYQKITQAIVPMLAKDKELITAFEKKFGSMKKISTQMKKLGFSTKESTDLLRGMVNMMKEDLKVSRQKVREDQKKADVAKNVKKQAKILKDELRSLAQQTGMTAEAQKVLNGQYGKTKESLGIFRTRVNKAKASLRELRRVKEENRKQLDDLIGKYNKAGLAILRFGKKVKTANKDTKLWTRNLRNSNSTFSVFRSKLLLGAFAISLYSRSIGKLLKLHGLQQASELKVKNALIQTGMSAGITYGEIVNLTKSLQENGVVSDEVNLQMSALMLTYDNIGRNVFPSALKAANDMATTLEMGIPTQERLASTVTMLAKALQQPEKGMNALRRVGFSLNAVDRERIVTLMHLNKTQKAQNVILEAANKQYGNMAKIIRTSTLGQINDLKMAIGDLGEEFGEGLLPIMKPMIEGFSDFAKSITPEGVRQFRDTIGALTVVMIANKVITSLLTRAQLALKISALDPSIISVGKLTRATKLLSVANKAAFGPIMLIAGVAIALLPSIKRMAGGYKEGADDARNFADAQLQVLEVSNRLDAALVKQAKKEAYEKERDVLLELNKAQKATQTTYVEDRKTTKVLTEDKMKLVDGTYMEIDAYNAKVKAQQEIVDSLYVLMQAQHSSAIAADTQEEHVRALNKSLDDQLAILRVRSKFLMGKERWVTPGGVATIMTMNEGLSRSMNIFFGMSKGQKIAMEAQLGYEKAAAKLNLTLAQLNETDENGNLIHKETIANVKEMANATVIYNTEVERQAQIAQLAGEIRGEAFNYMNQLADAEIAKQNEIMQNDIDNVKQTSTYKIAQKRGDTVKMKQLEKKAMEATFPDRKRAAKQKLGLAIADIALSTAVGVMKAFRDFGPAGAIPAAMITSLGLIQGAAAVQANPIPKFAQGGMIGGRRHSLGGTMIEAEAGEFIMNRGAVQSVGMENLNRMNQGGGGGGVTVNVSGNVLSQDFVEGELAENIKEAIRRGTDFGIS